VEDGAGVDPEQFFVVSRECDDPEEVRDDPEFDGAMDHPERGNDDAEAAQDVDGVFNL
jgi:hypothetical protein